MVKQKNISNAEHIAQQEPMEMIDMVPFAFIVDNEVVNRGSVPRNSKLYDIYNNDPKILNINHLEYLPNLNDEYVDGFFIHTEETSFVDPKTQYHPFDFNPEDLIPFVFLIDNKVKQVVRVGEGSMFEAVFNSDPKIMNVEEYENAFFGAKWNGEFFILQEES
jgi:hypothetical protein